MSKQSTIAQKLNQICSKFTVTLLKGGDYGHKKTGIRVTGLVYSGVIFFIKMGIAIGGALAGWLLTFYDYQADVVQSETTKQHIILV